MNNRKPMGNYHWTTKDIATIRAMAESGTGYVEIARVIDRPVDRVRDVAAKNGIRINKPPSRAARLREMGIPSRTFYTVREELRDAGVEHTEQDIIAICKARRRA